MSLSNEEVNIAQLQEPLVTQRREASSDGSIHEDLVDGLAPKTSALVKSLFFLDALGSSTWGRFSAIYYNIHGLNSRHIGLVEAIRSIIPTISMVFWGVVADRLQSQKRVWLLTESVSTIILLTLAFPCVYSSFLRILVVSALAQVFVSNGILDAYTLDLLGPENKSFYGRYRLFASLSWGLGSIVIGWVTDRWGSFEPNFVLFGGLSSLLIALVATKVPFDAIPEHHQLHLNQEKFKELIALVSRPRVLIFLAEVVLMGAGMATVERLLFLYMVNDLKASTLLCGLSVGVNVLFELPIFWYAGNIMKFMGRDGMFITSMSCFVFRLYGYTLLTPNTKALILVLEILHGVTFACFWVVTTDISKILVHQTTDAFWKTTIPNCVQMLYSAVGVALGSILGGWAMHQFGSRIMYIYTANIVGVALILHLIGFMTCKMVYNGKGLLPEDYITNADEEVDRREEELSHNDDDSNASNLEQTS